MNRHEAVEFINLLIYDIKRDGRNTAYKLQDALHDFCSDIYICPICGGDRKLETNEEYQGDALGIPAFEEWDEWVCDDCGWRSDKEA
jgi:rubrerythrin